MLLVRLGLVIKLDYIRLGLYKLDLFKIHLYELVKAWCNHGDEYVWVLVSGMAAKYFSLPPSPVIKIGGQ